MDLDQVNGTTTAFYTLHSCDGDLALEISEILRQSDKEKVRLWQLLVSERPTLRSRLVEQGLEEPADYGKISWDETMILFLCSINIDDEGKPMAIGESLKRERFGRFPYGDGSLIKYLIEFLRPNTRIKNSNQILSKILDLLNKLTSFNHAGDYSSPRFAGGSGGMSILGFLNLSEVTEMRKLFAGRNWSVASDEPLDGGVRDAIKHLLAMLRAAERLDSGVMLRSHA